MGKNTKEKSQYIIWLKIHTTSLMKGITINACNQKQTWKQQSRDGSTQKLTLLSIGVNLPRPSVFFFSELWLGASQSYSTSGLDKSRQKVQIHSPLLGDKVYEFLTHHFSLHQALSHLLHAIYDTDLFGMNFKFGMCVYHIATVYIVPC